MVLKHTQQSRQYFNQTHYRAKSGRGNSGSFAKRPQQNKYYQNNNNIVEYKYIPEKEEYEKVMYRAVVTLNGVPIHSDKARGRSRYKNFSWAKVDYYENINIDDMKKNLLTEIAKHFHCTLNDLWFSDGIIPWGETDWGDIEYPKPYHGSQYEGLESGEY
jgi:hypothetical protein